MTLPSPRHADVARPNVESPARIPELDGIRGLAILMVLTWHFFVGGGIPVVPGAVSGYVAKLLHHTYSGVDLFFVLSGFLISRILLQSIWADNGLKVFWVRRLFRIAPLYVLFLAVSWLLAATGPFSGLSFGLPTRIWPYLFSLQSLDMASQGDLGPWGLTWSLALEEQYYLLLPLLLLLVGRKSFLPVMIVFAIVPYYLRTQVDGLAGFVLLPCRLDGFAVGGVLAWVSLDSALTGKLRRHQWFPWTLFLMGLALYALITIRKADRNPVDHLVFAFSYGALILVCLTSREHAVSWLMRRRWLCRLGVISYPVYLFHEIVYEVLKQSTSAWTQSWGGAWLLAFGASFASIGVAELLHRIIGDPLVRYGRRVASTRYTVAKPAAQTTVALEVGAGTTEVIGP